MILKEFGSPLSCSIITNTGKYANKFQAAAYFSIQKKEEEGISIKSGYR